MCLFVVSTRPDSNRPKKEDRYRRDEKKEDRYKRDDKTDERTVDRSKDRSKDRLTRTRGDKRPSRKNDRKVLMAEESTKSWAHTDSDSTSSSSSSSDSEQEEVHCLMADQTSDDEKPASYRTGLGFNSSESSSGETSTQSQLVYDKFNKMSSVKASMIHDPCESMTYNDQTSPKLNHKGKAGIGFQRPENSKPSWLKNKLDKDKAKAGSKSFAPNQPRPNSTKVKSGWRKVQPRRDPNGQNMKSTLNRSHHGFAQTLANSSTGKTVKVIQVWILKGVIRSGPK
ncbi:hypothetical protein F511_18356 [Dorcoceras hygrometricum]|uniref:Uncharacterized protein n=1 Tax=Dorcoceras hygrometricum TaxID=472368 RepID=A0A2Z7C096_9LAMI|nr:hypothetical protein F511_18356 [Dorcoceras hygrometricum]